MNYPSRTADCFRQTKFVDHIFFKPVLFFYSLIYFDDLNDFLFVLDEHLRLSCRILDIKIICYSSPSLLWHLRGFSLFWYLPLIVKNAEFP